MLGWLKRRRHQREKQEVMRIGHEAVQRVNAGVERWRAERIALRREMAVNSFDERLVTLTASDTISYEEVITLDAMAFTKNWHTGRDEIVGRTIDYISDEDMDVLEALGASERLAEMFNEAWREETALLDAHVDESLREAMARHSAA